jgi:uncharacterized protein (TIGR03083 family)
MAPVNPMSYEGKQAVLDVIKREAGEFFRLAEDPNNWNLQTRCTEWEVRDLVGHMIDVTEGYLDRWDKAKKGEKADVLPLTNMAHLLNKGAQSFRTLSRSDALERLHSDYDQMMATFESLSEEDWNKFMVTHGYMGPLPTFFYPAFHVMDYGVHTWDIHYGLGQKTRRLDPRTSGVLIPYMLYALMPNTVDANASQGVDITYGLDIAGEWGGKWKVTAKDGKWQATPDDGSFAGCDAIFEYDPSDFVLTCYGRFPGGAARGDEAVIEKARHLFFAI